MIDKATIEITVNTETDDFQLKVINLPKLDKDMIDDFMKKHPASAVAYVIANRFEREVKTHR